MNSESNFLLAQPSSRINNSGDTSAWEKMAAIKSNILRRWDTAAAGVRVCCIKFVQKVIQIGTPGVIADPRVSRPCRVIYRLKADMIKSVPIRMKHLLRWYLETTHSYRPGTLKLKPPVCSTDYSTSSRRIQGIGRAGYETVELIRSLQRRSTGKRNAQLRWDTRSNTPVHCQQNPNRHLELQPTQTSQFPDDTEAQGRHQVNGANDEGVAHKRQ